MDTTADQHVERVRAVLENHREDISRTLGDLIEVPSVNPNYPGADHDAYIGYESEANLLLKERFSSYFDKAETLSSVARRENFAGRINGRGNGRSLILNGHVDVVPPGDEGNWEREPFAPEVQDGKIFGRGASDMKSGVVSAFWAVRALQEAGVPLKGDLIVQSVAGEELGEHEVGTSNVLAAGYTADAAIVLEPSASFSTPLNINPTAASLLWGQVRVEGLAGHIGLRRELVRAGGAGDAAGVNAIDKGYLVLQALYQLEQNWGIEKQAPLFPAGHFSIMPGVINGQGRDINIPFIFSEYCDIDFCAWYPPFADPEQVKAEIQDFIVRYVSHDRWLTEHPPIFTWKLDFPGYQTPVEHPIVGALGHGHQQATGRNATIEAFPAACDATWIASSGIPVVNYGPGHLANAHKANEWCSLSEVHDAALSIALTAMNWCGVAD